MPLNKKSVTAVLFDMDGVIVDSMRHHASCWISVLRDYGLVLDETDILRREGMSGLESVKDIFREKEVPCPGADEIESLMNKKHHLFESGKVGIYPYVRDILAALKSKKILTGLVTGSLGRSVRHVLPGDVRCMFDTLVTADDFINGKPHPEPYLTALVNLGIGREGAIVIENAPMGINSAKSAGLVCYAVRSTLPREHLMGADMIFSDHEELYGFIKDITAESVGP